MKKKRKEKLLHVLRFSNVELFHLLCSSLCDGRESWIDGGNEQDTGGEEEGGGGGSAPEMEKNERRGEKKR